MVSGVKVSGKKSHSIKLKTHCEKNQIIAESKNIKEVINNMGMQVAMVDMMVLRDTEAGPS